MGLNPPFGVKASLANKFIDKALSFKPKLVVLIVPKETKRYAPYSCRQNILLTISVSHFLLGIFFLCAFIVWLSRLDQKKIPYDLIWEDSECLAGKVINLDAFY